MSLTMPRRAPSGIASLTLVSILHTSVAAWAQVPPSAPEGAVPPAGQSEAADASSTRERARAAYDAGQDAYEAGQFAAAEAHFARADSLIPAVQAKFWRAMSLDQLGDVPRAHAAFEAVLNDPRKADLGPEKLETATARQRALASVPAELSVSTTPAGARVQVSGVDLASPTPLSLRLAPGRHLLIVSLPGYQPQRVELEATPGAKLESALALVPLASGAAPPVPALSAPPAEFAPTTTSAAPSRVPGFVTLGIAGASAVVGTIFGIRALGDKQDFDDAPSASKADDVERNALIADMAFGVTLTLGITGLVLLLADDPVPVQGQNTAPRASTAHGGVRILPYVSTRGGGAAAALEF